MIRAIILFLAACLPMVSPAVAQEVDQFLYSSEHKKWPEHIPWFRVEDRIWFSPIRGQLCSEAFAGSGNQFYFGFGPIQSNDPKLRNIHDPRYGVGNSFIAVKNSSKFSATRMGYLQVIGDGYYDYSYDLKSIAPSLKKKVNESCYEKVGGRIVVTDFIVNDKSITLLYEKSDRLSAIRLGWMLSLEQKNISRNFRNHPQDNKWYSPHGHYLVTINPVTDGTERLDETFFQGDNLRRKHFCTSPKFEVDISIREEARTLEVKLKQLRSEKSLIASFLEKTRDANSTHGGAFYELLFGKVSALCDFDAASQLELRFKYLGAQPSSFFKFNTITAEKSKMIHQLDWTTTTEQILPYFREVLVLREKQAEARIAQKEKERIRNNKKNMEISAATKKREDQILGSCDQEDAKNYVYSCVPLSVNYHDNSGYNWSCSPSLDYLSSTGVGIACGNPDTEIIWNDKHKRCESSIRAALLNICTSAAQKKRKTD